MATTANSVLSTTEVARPVIATTSRTTTMRVVPAIRAKDAPTEATVATEEATMDPATTTTNRNNLARKATTTTAASAKTSAHPAPVTTTTTKKAVNKECRGRIAATRETTEALNSMPTPVEAKDKKGNPNSNVSLANPVNPVKNIEAVAVEAAETAEIEPLAATTRMLKPAPKTTPKTTTTFL